MPDIVGLFRKSKNTLETGGITPIVEEKIKCPNCKFIETKKKVAKNKVVCPACGHHYRIGARARLKTFCDKGSIEELFTNLRTNDPLEFPNYEEKLEHGRNASSEDEAVVCVTATVKGEPCAIFVMDSQFMMGSMGSVVGEKITRLFEYAAEKALPVIGFTASGGARMQEGILSLMQMAKVSGAVDYHSKRGGLYITVLTDPTTGGVTASFAMLGDIIISEPKATIGFAGRRVIEQTTKKKLPEDFQTAEFLLEHGFIDAIVPRPEMRQTVAKLLAQHNKKRSKKLCELNLTEESIGKIVNKNLSAYERLQLARAQNRPTARAYIERMFTDRTELHGDRKYSDDKAIIGGIGLLDGVPTTFIGIERGRDLKERIACNFGCPMPDGYRKALRLMEQAEKFGRPIICFVDTSGAFCGEDAEERGQGQAIADNLMKMMALKTPIITVVIGEGGSGGALGLSVASRVYMLENSVFSVISPEGCASILWGEASQAPAAADCLCITAEDMQRFGVAERIIPETFDQFSNMCNKLKNILLQDLQEISKDVPEVISAKRYQRFRKLGSYDEINS